MNRVGGLGKFAVWQKTHMVLGGSEKRVMYHVSRKVLISFVIILGSNAKCSYPPVDRRSRAQFLGAEKGTASSVDWHIRHPSLILLMFLVDSVLLVKLPLKTQGLSQDQSLEILLFLKNETEVMAITRVDKVTNNRRA